MADDWAVELDGISTAVLLVIQFCAIVHILISKRENPQQAAFWIVLTALLPGVGVAAYLLFGITFFEHASNVIARVRQDLSGGEAGQFKSFASVVRKLRNFQLSGAEEQSARALMLDRLFPDYPAVGGNELELLQDGVMTYPRMLEDIRNAQKSIRLQSYILNSDEVGTAFMEALNERAAAGVDVKVMFDSVGSVKSCFSQYFRKELRLQQKNLKIRPFSQINLLAPWKFQLRNHRKLLVVDGRVAYVGGVNISAENERLRRLPPSRYIHDLHCRIIGPAVVQFTTSFLTDYLYTLPRRRSKNIICEGDCTLPEYSGKHTVRVIPGGLGNSREASRKLFFAAAALAQKELWILTPYFVPGRDYVEALCMAAVRGVDVRLVVPARSNHFLVDCAARNFYERLHEAGVSVYEKLGYFSHAKALLVDSTWGFMGSSNCDSRSFHLNFELDFVFEGEPFTGSMVQQFREEFAGARKLTSYRLRAVPPLRKLLNSAAALFTPVM